MNAWVICRCASGVQKGLNGLCSVVKSEPGMLSEWEEEARREWSLGSRAAAEIIFTLLITVANIC